MEDMKTCDIIDFKDEKKTCKPACDNERSTQIKLEPPDQNTLYNEIKTESQFNQGEGDKEFNKTNNTMISIQDDVNLGGEVKFKTELKEEDEEEQRLDLMQPMVAGPSTKQDLQAK